MNRTIKQQSLPGVPYPQERDYEIRNRQLARAAAAEGMVLLKNDNNILPIPKGTSIALYGAGAAHTLKGGTGSGDVNSRGTVSILEGLRNAGYRIATQDWLDAYDEAYAQARAAWRESVWQKEAQMREADDSGFHFFFAYTETPFLFPVGDLPEKAEAETAIYVLSRQAGEGKDRADCSGDFTLSGQEERVIERICALYPHVLIVLNTGGIVDLSFVDRQRSIEGVIYMHQPG
ncbi:MAG: glycoside hydrolase family 3 C-terminal domain-containing protein, partial [Lachnospiraceae bacterium]|nr:glycoside hydrolase family 3 C-terminal domain-containing protein [Lachnospiraceae bacterium]